MRRPGGKERKVSANGAPELFRLWNAIPLRRITIAVVQLPPAGLAALNDRLRYRCWREFCAAPKHSTGMPTATCAELGHEPRCAHPCRCAAHALFPTEGTDSATGERFNRNAFLPTVHCRWLPRRGEFVLWLFGAAALAAESIVLREVADWLGSSSPRLVRTDGTLDSLLPAKTGEYRLEMVSPWILSKDRISNARAHDLGKLFSDSLLDSLKDRARKLTNTCVMQLPEVASTPLGVRMLLGFSAEYIVRDLWTAEHGAKLIGHQLSLQGWKRRSGRQGQTFDEVGVQGWVRLEVGAAAAPLLPLIAVFGVGDSADKAYDSVEFTRLDNDRRIIRSLP